MNKHEETKNEILSRFMIAIDGPSGSGKSSTARAVARALDLRHIDTGAMYRAVTHAALERGVPPGDNDALGVLTESLDIRTEPREGGDVAVFVDGEDVSSVIRSARVTETVSQVSAHPRVRRAMVRRQRAEARGGGVVLEGRDIGSVVLPWADLKIYLDASPEVRAARRREQILAAGESVSIEEIEADQRRRDEQDSGREESPLQRAVGAWPVDTSGKTIPEQVDEVLRLAGETVERLTALYQPRPGLPTVWKRRLVFLLAQEAIAFVAYVIFGLKVLDRLDGRLEESYLMAPNHISNVDPPFIGSTTRRELHFVAKSGLFKVRWFAKVLRTVNAFPIRRAVFDRKAMGIALSLLREGHSVMVFPEGGRVFGGELGKPRSGVGYLAIQSGVAVVPAYIKGSDRLWRCLFRRERMVVNHGHPIRIPPLLAEEYRRDDDRATYRRYSEMVMAAIAALRDEVSGN